MAVVEPPLHPLFGHPKHFEKLVASVVARIPHGSVLLVARSSPTTWMDATLAGAVAARISGSVLAIGLSKDSSAANNEAATLASSAALIGEIPTASACVEASATSAFLCCAWVHAEVAPHLDALVRTYTQGPAHASTGTASTSSRSSSSIAVQRAVRVVGLVSVRFEQSPATSFLEGLGPVIACSFSRDGGPLWQPSQPSPIPTLLKLPNPLILTAPTTSPTGGNADAAPSAGSGNRKRQRAPSPSAVLAEPAVDVATAVPGRLGGNVLVDEARARLSASNVMLDTSEPEAVDEALTRGSEDAQMETSPTTAVPAVEVVTSSGPAIAMPGVGNTIDLTKNTDVAEGVTEAPMMGGSEHLPETLSDSGSNSNSSSASNYTSRLNAGSSSSGSSSGNSSFYTFVEGGASTNSDNNESSAVAAGVQEQLGCSPLGMCSFGYGANAPSEDRSSSLRVPGLRCCPPDTAHRDHANNAPEHSEDGPTTAHLYLVADGHGGGLAAQFVNDHLLVEVAQQLRQLPAYDDSAAAAAAAAEATAAAAAVAAAATTVSGADTPGRLQAAVQAALVKAFAATEAAFLASLDATWAYEQWQAVDDEDQEQRRRRSHSQLPPPSLLLLPESALPAATSSSSVPESAGIAVGRAAIMVDSSTAASEPVAVVNCKANDVNGGGTSHISGNRNRADCTTSSTNSNATKSRTNTNTSHGLAAGLCNAGSCAVLVCVLGGWLYTAHVGDCRAVLASLVPADTSSEMATSSPVEFSPAATAAAGETTGGAEEAPSSAAAVAATAAGDSSAAPVGTSEAAGNSSSSSATATPRRQRSSAGGGGSQGREVKRSRRSSSLSAGASSLPPLVVDALTSDQNCYRKDEVERVVQLASSDPEPIRPSKNDQKALDARAKKLAQRQLAKDRAAQGLNNGDGNAAAGTAGGAATDKGKGNPKLSRGAVARGRGGTGGGKGGKGRGKGSEPMLRVAGSLAVTRAFGDMYLKHRRYAPEDLRPRVPYLIAKPETSCRRLRPELDTMLVMASDGLWEVATPEQACGWAATHLANHGLTSSSSTCTAPPSLPVPTEATATIVTTADASTGAGTDGHEIAGQANSSAITAVAATGITEVGHQPIDAELQVWSASKRLLRGRTSDRSSRSASHSSNNSSGQVNVAQEVVLQALSTCAAKARMSALELSRLPPGPERRKFHDDVTVLVVMLPAAQYLDRNSGSDD